MGYILLATIIYNTVDYVTFAKQIKQFTTPTILILLTVATVDRFVMAYKWMHLCVALKLEAKFSRFLKMYYVASFLGYCLPTSLGAEAYKAARLSRYENGHKVFASMFMEKIVGIFATVSYAWVGVLYLSFSIEASNSCLLFYILIGVSIFALGATWASMHPGMQNIIISLGGRIGIAKSLKKLTEVYGSYKTQKITILLNYIVALFESALQLFIMCGVAIELNSKASLLVLISIIAITEFVRRAAIILDGWGLATALQIFMYGLVGITGEQALLIALLSHAIHFTASIPGGGLMLTDHWDRA